LSSTGQPRRHVVCAMLCFSGFRKLWVHTCPQMPGQSSGSRATRGGDFRLPRGGLRKTWTWPCFCWDCPSRKLCEDITHMGAIIPSGQLDNLVRASKQAMGVVFLCGWVRSCVASAMLCFSLPNGVPGSCACPPIPRCQ
jgi:hypothetical protein